MYHIFVVIALNATQNQVNEVKKYYNNQVKQEIDRKENGKNPLIPSYPAQPDSHLDVLEQFKKELNQEDEAINKLAKADLESLGLDPIDDLSKNTEKKPDDEFASSAGQLDQKVDIEKIPTENSIIDNPTTTPEETTDKAADFVALANKFSAEQKKSETIKNQEPPEKTKDSINQDTKNNENSAKVPEQELKEVALADIKSDKTETIKTDDVKKEDLAKTETNKKESKEEPKKIEDFQTKIDQMVEKLKKAPTNNSPKIPEKISDVIDDKQNIKNEDNKNNKEDNKKENAPKIEEPKINVEKPKTKKELAKELALKKKMEAEEAREARKLEKLNKLRDKYLAKLEDNEDDADITEYQKISKIIPQQKLLPKYIGYQIPPQLLSRYRSPDNNHHPIIITYNEKVDLMFKAVAEDRVDDFNSLFDEVNRPNLKNSYGDTLLSYAILMQKYPAIVSLLSKGANPDLQNDLCYTPLNLAIELTDYRSTAILLDMGANPNYTDGLGRTYLIQAVRIGSLPIVDLLLSKGVNINAKDRYGFTALDIAIRFDKKVIAKYLQKNGGQNSRREYKLRENSLIDQLNKRWN